MIRKKDEKKEKPFEGKKVFFSGTIRGAGRKTPGLFWELVQFMKKGGAEVLTEHIAARKRTQRDSIFFEKTGIDIDKLEDPRVVVRKIDIGWVDEADYLVAEVTSPSLGVGMEIQRALDKDRLGLNHTKILCLCKQDVLVEEKLSWMIRGVTPREHSDFYLIGYKTIAEAKKIVFKFLIDSLDWK